MSSIIVQNLSPNDIYCFVSKYSHEEADDSWFKLAANGGTSSWSRSSWELVAFKNLNDSTRAGVYIQTNKKVIFSDFNNIRVE